MTSKEHKVMRFPNQKNRTPHGIVVEDTEVRVFGWRRGRGGLLNESGDHVAYVFVEVTFWDPCREKEEVNPVPKRWKLTGFSMQYGVFLRSQHPPALDTESKKMPEIPNETWEEFVDRFISMAQAIKRKQ